VHLPLNVHFDLTYRCNERCIHCYLEHDDLGEVTTKEVKNILDQLAEAGTLLLTFSGGEIFLRQDIFELLDYARALHFDISLKSNALLVDEKRAARLKQLGVRKVQVSLYSSDPAIHDSITMVPGSLERTLRGIEVLRRQGIVVTLSCPLMKRNLAAFQGVQALAAQLGLTYVIDPTISPMINGDRPVTQQRLDAQELLPVLTDDNLNPHLRRSAAPAENSEPQADAATQAWDDIPCSAGQNSCYITPYGDVYPCVQLVLPSGNLRRQRFREIWFRSPEMERVRAVRESMLSICSGCDIRKYCERCPGLALMEDGDLLGPSERACELAEMNARLAGVANPVSAYRASQPLGNQGRKSETRGHGLVHITPAAAATSETGVFAG
jgi:radical SAM protein with 4Fe4S-binding SPASM domain